MSADIRRSLEAWLPPAGAGAPVGCIATTFTFDPDFFEEECLGRFLGLDSAVLSDTGTADAAYYVIQREAALEEARATVLVDRGHVSPATSHRWDVIAAGAPPGGVQHAKLSVLVWEHTARIIVGSANLTPAGYRDNIEVLTTFDWPNEARVAHLFASAADFLGALLTRHTAGGIGTASPRDRATHTIAALRDRLNGHDLRPARRGEPTIELVHSLAEGSLLDQAFERCWRGGPPAEATVVSPYFVSRGVGLRRPEGLDAVRARLSRQGDVRCEVAVTTVELPAGQVRVNAPVEVQSSTGRGELAVLHWDRPSTESERALHAKVLRWGRDGWTLLLAGSANCTGAGLGLDGAPRNVELSLAIGDRSSTETGRALRGWLPKLGRLPAGEHLWDRAFAEEDDAFSARLPDKFREALYHPLEDVLSIDLGPELRPEWWEISDGDRLLLTSASYDGREISHVPLNGEPAPMQLEVRWQDERGDLGTAYLVVNVADPGALPSPPEISELTLEDLLELLGAGSRFRAALRRVLRRRGTTAGGSAPNELDPHARVDTSDFVLQRMRRAGRAFEGLRERLECPVSRTDALQRRLRGPFSPVALAVQFDLAHNDGRLGEREHAFLVAEIVLCLRRVRWHVVGEDFDEAWCRQQVDELVRELVAGVVVEDEAFMSYLKRAKESA